MERPTMSETDERRDIASRPYRGAGFSIMGDSISTLAGWVPDGWRVHYQGEARIDGVERFEDTWWGRVIGHFGGHLVANSSFSGATVEAAEGFGFPAGDSDERVCVLAGAGGELPDAVIVFMGINDYGWGGARNQAMGRSAAASARPKDFTEPREVAATVGAEELARFCRAYAGMLVRIGELAPDANIWCVTLAPGSVSTSTTSETCWKYRIRGIDLDDYNRVIREEAAAVGAHVADMRAFGVDYDAVDGVHPSARGMAQIAAMIAAQMEGRPVDPAVLPELRDAQRSKRRCFRESCEGCELADRDPTRWTLLCAGPNGR